MVKRQLDTPNAYYQTTSCINYVQLGWWRGLGGLGSAGWGGSRRGGFEPLLIRFQDSMGGRSQSYTV